MDLYIEQIIDMEGNVVAEIDVPIPPRDTFISDDGSVIEFCSSGLHAQIVNCPRNHHATYEHSLICNRCHGDVDQYDHYCRNCGAHFEEYS